MTRPALLFILAALLILPAACISPNRRGEPFATPADISKPSLALGQRVFYQNCNVCHPGGSAGYGPSLNATSPPAWYVRFRVRTGLGAMPSFDENRISDRELEAVALYVQARP